MMRTQHGFTLVELVVVILITGILALVAIPRIASTDEFAARGAYDFTMSGLRYAQKSAMAMRRNVCASLSGSTMTVTYASAAGVGAACSGTNLLLHPANNLPFSNAANVLPSGSAYTGSNALTFFADGTPSAAQVVTIAKYPTPVTVEAVTGYVH